MNTPTRDPLARTYIAAQAARERDRQRRRAPLCECGREYADTVSGRHTHRVVLGHTPQHAGFAS